MRILLILLFAVNAHAATLAEQVFPMQPGTWAAVSADNLAINADPGRDINTNPRYPNAPPYNGNSGFKAHFGAWNSGTYVPDGACGAIVHFGGGHADYHGNQVTALELCGGETGGMKWQRWTAPYLGAITWPALNGGWPDGTPTAVHTYDGLASGAGKVFTTSSQSCYTSGGCGTVPQYSPDLWMFDTASKTWSGPHRHLGAQASVAAWDSKRAKLWFQPDPSRPGQFQSFDPATLQFTAHGKPNAGALDASMGYDPIGDRLVLTTFRNSPYNVWERDPGNPNLPWVLVPQVNKPAGIRHGQHVMAWSPMRQAWIVFDALNRDGKVFEMRRTPAAYEWTLLTDAGNTFVPPSENVGTFDRLQLVTLDDHEYLVGLMSVTSGIVAFRIPDGVAAPPPPPPVDCVPPEQYRPLCPVAEIPPSSDFALCNEPGVFKCDDFSNPLTDNKGLPRRFNTGFATPEVKDGQLAFTLPSGSGADAGGNMTFGIPLTGQGKMVAFTYKVKADAAAMALAGRKEWIIWRGASSCTDLQAAQTHLYSSPVISLYTDCGAFSPTIKLDGDYLVHYPDYHCLYSDYSRNQVYDRCAITRVDQWDQYYVEIAVGVLNQPNSRITAWHRPEGGEWKRYIDTSTYILHGSSVSGGALESFMLTAYMTGKPQLPHPDGHVWFDDLALGSQPFGRALGIGS